MNDQRIAITRSTGITVSLALLISMAALFYAAGSRVTGIESRTDRNTQDIAALVTKIDSLNENLTRASENIIRLNTRLDALTDRSNGNDVSVGAPLPFARLVVVPSHDSRTIIQPAQNGSGGSQRELAPPSQPDESEPEPDTAPLPGIIQTALQPLQSTLDFLEGVL